MSVHDTYVNDDEDVSETSGLVKTDADRNRRGSVNGSDAEVPGDGKTFAVREMSIITAASSMLNSVIGVGILALANSFSRVGWVLGCVLLIVCGLMSSATLVLIGIVCTEVKAFSYGDMMNKSSGKFLGKAASCFVILHMFGVSVAYTIASSRTLVDIIDGIRIRAGADPQLDWYIMPDWWFGGQGPFEANRKFWVVILTCGIIWPLCMLKSYKALSGVSIAATASMLYLAGVLAFRGFEGIARGTGIPTSCPGAGADTGPFLCEIKPVVFDSNIFNSFSTFVFAFLTHSMAPQVIAEFKQPTNGRLTKLMATTSGVSGMLYAMVGIMGYLQFADSVGSNVTESYSQDILMWIAQFFVICSIMAGYATNVWPCRDALLQLFFDDGSGTYEPPSIRTKRIWATWVVIAATLLGFFVSDLGDVIDLVGAVGGGVMSFVFPFVAHANIRFAHKKGLSRVFTWSGILAVLGTAFTCTNTAFVLYDVITDDPIAFPDPLSGLGAPWRR